MLSFARLQTQQEYSAEAEAQQKQVLEVYKTAVASQRRHTAKITRDLAQTVSEQGKCEEAEALFKEVVASHKATVEDCHWKSMRTMDDLREMYAIEDRQHESDELDHEIIRMYKGHMGQRITRRSNAKRRGHCASSSRTGTKRERNFLPRPSSAEGA